MDAAQRKQAIIDALHELLQRSPDITIAFVIDLDANLLATTDSEVEKDEILPGVLAQVLNGSEYAASAFGDGTVDLINIRTGNGFLSALVFGDQYALVSRCRKNTMLGLVFLDMKRTSEEIEKALPL